MAFNLQWGRPAAQAAVSQRQQQLQHQGPLQPGQLHTPAAALNVTAVAPVAHPSGNASSTRAVLMVMASTSQTVAAAAPGMTAPVADPCLDLSGMQARAVGAMLGAMCGNALGLQVEPEKHYRLSRMFPDGLQDLSWTFDISSTPLPPGHVSGDFTAMVAVGQSLVQCGRADALDIAQALAQCFNGPSDLAHCSPYTRLALEGLAAGSNPFQLAHLAEGYLALTPSRASQTASHRPDRQLHGINDFTALVRVLPVGLAYREATPQVLRQAADAAVLFTHPTETASDAAAVITAAVAWLARADADATQPSELLAHLHSNVAQTSDMKDKLQLLQGKLSTLQGLGSIDNWRQFWQSKSWSDITATANLLMKQNLAVQATQAAALALWVLAVSWNQPKQAVMLGASLGGYAGTTAALVGGLTGALHGCSWVPRAWWVQLQEPPTAAAASGQEHHSNPAQHGHQQQHQPHEVGGQEQLAAEKSGSDAAQAADGEAADDGDHDQQQEQKIVVGKRDVVALGQELAGLNCCEPPELL